MKKLILIVAIVFASTAPHAAQADMVSIKKMKCSTFGNLKIKVNGLERHRSLGTGYLKADVPLFDSCKDALVEVRGRMGRSTQQAEVNIEKRIVTEIEHRRDRVDPPRIPRIGFKSEKLDTIICHVYEDTALTMIFNRMPELKFKNYSRKHLRTTYGYCH